MRAVPENGTVLCEQVAGGGRVVDESGIQYEREELPVYRVLAVSGGERTWRVGDEVVCSSTGTKLRLPGGVQYLFKSDSIAGRIAER